MQLLLLIIALLLSSASAVLVEHVVAGVDSVSQGPATITTVNGMNNTMHTPDAETIQPSQICGFDSRIVVAPASDPYRYTAYMSVTFSPSGNVLQCSASIISQMISSYLADKVLLTAAHCLYNTATYERAASISIIFPGFASTAISISDFSTWFPPAFVNSPAPTSGLDVGVIFVNPSSSAYSSLPNGGLGFYATDFLSGSIQASITGYDSISGSWQLFTTGGTMSSSGGLWNYQWQSDVTLNMGGGPIMTWYDGVMVVIGVHAGGGASSTSCVNLGTRLTPAVMDSLYAFRYTSDQLISVKSAYWTAGVYYLRANAGQTSVQISYGSVGAGPGPYELWMFEPLSSNPSFLNLQQSFPPPARIFALKSAASGTSYVYLSLNGGQNQACTGQGPFTAGCGAVNLAQGIGSYEELAIIQGSGTIVGVQSLQWINCNLRMDGSSCPGNGNPCGFVNMQNEYPGVGAFESFYLSSTP